MVTLALFYQWFLVSLMFYGFYYALEGISGSVTVNFLIMAVLEVDILIVMPFRISIKSGSGATEQVGPNCPRFPCLTEVSS